MEPKETAEELFEQAKKDQIEIDPANEKQVIECSVLFSHLIARALTEGKLKLAEEIFKHCADYGLLRKDSIDLQRISLAAVLSGHEDLFPSMYAYADRMSRYWSIDDPIIRKLAFAKRDQGEEVKPTLWDRIKSFFQVVARPIADMSQLGWWERFRANFSFAGSDGYVTDRLNRAIAAKDYGSINKYLKVLKFKEDEIGKICLIIGNNDKKTIATNLKSLGFGDEQIKWLKSDLLLQPERGDLMDQRAIGARLAVSSTPFMESGPVDDVAEQKSPEKPVEERPITRKVVEPEQRTDLGMDR